MQRTAFWALVFAAAVAWVTLPTRPVSADDETDDVEIKIRAPLDAVDCTGTPPTATVLGLAIDISAAKFDGDGSGDSSGDGSESDDASGAGPVGCAALTPGQSVEVQLASDTAPLAATKVHVNGGDNEAKIEAPIQTVDAGAQTITLLGLVIDVSGASLDGSDDSGTSTQPIDLTQLIPGQFVEVKLASNTPPLSATELEVKNFTNQVEVEVDDQSGNEIDDVDDNGDPVNDVDVEVVETVPVQSTSTVGATTRSRRVKKVVSFHMGSNGSFTLSGLPTGVARLTVTRSSGGTTTMARRRVSVRSNATRLLKVRLRPARSR